MKRIKEVSREEWLAYLLERYTEPEPNTGCLLWTGNTVRRGYPWKYTPNGSMRLVTRVILGLEKGDTLQACHRCDTPSCVNPHHLFAGTKSDNMRDMVAKGRGRGFTSRTECLRGHPFTPSNTRVVKTGPHAGKRKCRLCHNAAARLRSVKSRPLIAIQAQCNC